MDYKMNMIDRLLQSGQGFKMRFNRQQMQQIPEQQLQMFPPKKRMQLKRAMNRNAKTVTMAVEPGQSGGFAGLAPLLMSLIPLGVEILSGVFKKKDEQDGNGLMLTTGSGLMLPSGSGVNVLGENVQGEDNKKQSAAEVAIKKRKQLMKDDETIGSGLFLPGSFAKRY
jgi:hypothetical protein